MLRNEASVSPTFSALQVCERAGNAGKSRSVTVGVGCASFAVLLYTAILHRPPPWRTHSSHAALDKLPVARSLLRGSVRVADLANDPAGYAVHQHGHDSIVSRRLVITRGALNPRLGITEAV